jgi:uncharacterized RDD family membrane protein YckC
VSEQEHAESDPIPKQGGSLLDEQIASPKQRFGTFLLDLVFISLISLILRFYLVLGLILAGEKEHLKRDSVLFALIFPVIYYAVLESINGRTLGKYIMGTRAVKEDGTRLSPGRACLRTLCRQIPFDAFSFLGGEGPLRGWHDKVSKTIVISLKEAKQDEAVG